MTKIDTDRIFREAKKMAKRSTNATNTDLCYFLKRAKQQATRGDKIANLLLNL